LLGADQLNSVAFGDSSLVVRSRLVGAGQDQVVSHVDGAVGTDVIGQVAADCQSHDFGAVVEFQRLGSGVPPATAFKQRFNCGVSRQNFRTEVEDLALTTQVYVTMKFHEVYS
jgi:hypothetical protein